MNTRRFFHASLALGASITMIGCGLGQDYTSLTLTPNGDHFVAEGVIDGSTPRVVRRALRANPEIKTIVLQYVPGSANDEANLKASRMLREHKMTTIVPAGGLVASGGTDMFLAGLERKVGSGACLGVHSWSAGGANSETQGRDVPRDDPQHQLYLSYYEEMGIAPAFYWYTLEAADADNIHYMTNDEILEHEMATESIEGHDEASSESCQEIENRYGYS